MLTINVPAAPDCDRTAAIQTLPLQKLWQSDVRSQRSDIRGPAAAGKLQSDPPRDGFAVAKVSDQGSGLFELDVGRLLQNSPALCAFATLREKLLYLFRAGGLTLRRQAAKLSGPNEE
jgi:hypothetical protein